MPASGRSVVIGHYDCEDSIESVGGSKARLEHTYLAAFTFGSFNQATKRKVRRASFEPAQGDDSSGRPQRPCIEGELCLIDRRVLFWCASDQWTRSCKQRDRKEESKGGPFELGGEKCLRKSRKQYIIALADSIIDLELIRRAQESSTETLRQTVLERTCLSRRLLRDSN